MHSQVHRWRVADGILICTAPSFTPRPHPSCSFDFANNSPLPAKSIFRVGKSDFTFFSLWNEKTSRLGCPIGGWAHPVLCWWHGFPPPRWRWRGGRRRADHRPTWRCAQCTLSAPRWWRPGWQCRSFSCAQRPKDFNAPPPLTNTWAVHLHWMIKKRHNRETWYWEIIAQCSE